MNSGPIRSLEEAVRFAETTEPSGLGVYVVDWSGIVELCDREELRSSAAIDRWLEGRPKPGHALAAAMRLCYASASLRKYWKSDDLEGLNEVFRRITQSLGKDSARKALTSFISGAPQLNLETPAGGEEWVRPIWLHPPKRNAPYGVTLLLEVEPMRASEHELRRSEARYRAIVEDHTDFIVRYRADGVRTFVNDAYAEFFGGRPDEFVGTSFLDLIADEHRPEVEEKIRQLCDREIEVLPDEHLSRRHDGELRWTHWLDRAIFDAGGNLVELQAVGRDITERKEAEERRLRFERRMAQAQKMEALGALAGGLAHDFNNTLTGIGAYAELLRSHAGNVERVNRYADCLLEAAGQASGLVQNLLQLSRRSPRKAEPCSPAKILDSAHRLLRGVIPRQIELVVEAEDLPDISADSAQLTQAVINLGLNARDAMPNGGTLQISALRDGDEAIRIRVRDDGEGIADDVRERIFEPFFTTKPEGSGTGLGLAMVYACAQAHGGRVDVDSEIGCGTTVEMSLPLRAAPDRAGDRKSL